MTETPVQTGLSRKDNLLRNWTILQQLQAWLCQGLQWCHQDLVSLSPVSSAFHCTAFILKFILWFPVAPDLNHPRLKMTGNRLSYLYFHHKSSDTLRRGQHGSCVSPGPVTMAREVLFSPWLASSGSLDPPKEQRTKLLLVEMGLVPQRKCRIVLPGEKKMPSS